MLIMFSALLVLVVLFIDLVREGAPRLNWDFLTSFPSRKAERAGILSAWVGTSLIMVTTAAVSMPVGVAAAIYLEEYAPKNWVTAIIEINVTNLAGVPSIIYGLLALGLFVYQFNLGQSIAAAGLTLSLLILPIVIVATREALRAVPRAIREAAYALGATRWEVTAHHVLPYSTGGILTGMIIGLSRAIGETAPLITIGALSFIAFLPESPFKGEFPFFSFAWLKESFTAMPIQMFNWVSRPDPAVPGQCGCGGRDPARHDAADERRRDLCPLPLPQENQLVNTMQSGITTQDSPARPGAGTHAVDGKLSTPRPSVEAGKRSTGDDQSLVIKSRAEGLSFYYGEVKALKDLNIEIREKRVTALIGPSGCGKTTFLRCFNRMHDLTPGTRYEGRIMLYPDSLDLVGRGVDAIEVRMRIGMVFQKPNPFPKSIFDNVAYGLQGPRRALECAHRGAGRAGAAPGGNLGRGQGPPGQLGALAVGRPAAAPVHRARARDQPGDPAVRRADLGARPDRDRAHRGADRRAPRPGDGHHRHAQHAAGGARVGLHGVHVPRAS